MTGLESYHGLPEDRAGFDSGRCVFSLQQVEALPPEDRQEVLEFVAFVLRRRRQRAAAGETEREDDCRLRLLGPGGCGADDRAWE